MEIKRIHHEVGEYGGGGRGFSNIVNLFLSKYEILATESGLSCVTLVCACLTK
jgi:hypothetical protein